jgi:hypothetical protein
VQYGIRIHKNHPPLFASVWRIRPFFLMRYSLRGIGMHAPASVLSVWELQSRKNKRKKAASAVLDGA